MNANRLRKVKPSRKRAFTMDGMNRALVIAAISWLSASAFAQVADPVRLRQTVDGYRIELVIEAILDAAPDARHSAGYEHRVTLTVRQPKLGHRVQLDAVTLEVRERGHPGPSYELQPLQSPEGPAYHATVRMAVKGTYRMVVHATPQGTSKPLSAKFTYRHHH